MANFNEEDRQWLYDTMKSKGIDTGSYDDFKTSLNNDEDRQWYYDKGKELGLDLGTKKDFDDMMWERPAAQAPVAPQQSPKQDTVEIDGNVVTESQLDAMAAGAPVKQKPMPVMAQPAPLQPEEPEQPSFHTFADKVEQMKKLSQSQGLNNQWAASQQDVLDKMVGHGPKNFGDTMESVKMAEEVEAARRMNRAGYDQQHLDSLFNEHVMPTFAQERAAGEQRSWEANENVPQYDIPGAQSGFARLFERSVNYEKETDPAKIVSNTLSRVEKDNAFGDYVMGRMGIDKTKASEDGASVPQLSDSEKEWMKYLFGIETGEVADQISQRIYDQYKQEGAPESVLQYIAGKAFHENLAASLFNSMVTRAANSSGMREQLRAMAYEQYGQDQNWAVRMAGGAAPFAVDMVAGGFALPNAVGGAVVKGGVSMAAKQVTRQMAKRAAAQGLKNAALEEAVKGGAGVAERYLATQAPIVNLAIRSAGGAANFATYDMQSEVVRQIATGEFKPFDLIKEAVHGAVLGGVMGVAGGTIGHLTRNAGRMGKIAGGAAGLGAETTIFGISNGLQKAMDDGEDISSVDWADTMGEAFGQVVGMKAVGAVMHPREFLNRYRKSKDYDLQLNQRDLTELKEAGYNFDDIFKGLGKFGEMAPMESNIIRKATEITPGPEGTGTKRSTTSEEAWVDAEAYKDIMQNPDISSSTKRKIAYVATGTILTPEPVFGVQMTVGKDGHIELTTTNAYGSPIETKDYINEAKAKADLAELEGVSRINTIDGLERIAAKAGFDGLVDEAKGRTMAETGGNVDEVLTSEHVDKESANAVLDNYIKNLQEAYMQRFNEKLQRLGGREGEPINNDMEGKAGDEAGTTMATGGNESPAPATQQAGAAVEQPERSERRQAAYDRGLNVAINPADLSNITYESSLANARMMQLFPDNDPVMSHLRNDIIKAVADGNDAEADRLVSMNSGYMNARQKEAIEQYRDIMDTVRGVDDNVVSSIEAYQQRRGEELKSIAAPDGKITRIELADGTTAYYKAGDLNNKYGSVMVATAEGENKQVSVAQIKTIFDPINSEEQLQADVDAYGQQLESGYAGLANGTDFVEGAQVDLSIAGSQFRGTMIGKDAAGNFVFQLEDGSQMPMAPADAQRAVADANLAKINADLKNEKANDIMQQQTDRFTKGIAGYAEGKPDLTAKESDPKTVAEYMTKGVEDGKRDAVFNLVQQNIEMLNKQAEVASERVRTLTNKQQLTELTEQEEIALAESRQAIEDAEARRRKWGEIRQAMMTDEERLKFESERQKDIQKAMDDTKKNYQIGTISIGEAVPTSAQLLERFESKGDASDHIEKMMADTKAYYRDSTFPALSKVRDQINDYRQGLVDLNEGTLADLTRQLADLEAEETYLAGKQKELSKVASSIGRLYAAREKESMTPHEQKMAQLEKETNRDKKLKLAKEAYANDEEALAVLDDVEPQDVYEHIAANLGAGSINWEGIQRGEHYVRGLRDELGKDKTRGIGKDADTFGFNYFLAPEGKGKGIDEVVHNISEGSPYDTEEVRNALLDMLASAGKPTDISHRIIDDRIARAEEIYEENRRRDAEAEEDAKREAEDAAIMEMTGLTPEEYDAFISDLETRLAEQEGYKTSEEYFNQLSEENDRENEGSVGGSQEGSTPKEQGKEVEQVGAEAAGETSVANADAVTKVNKALDPVTNKYNSLAPIEVVSIDSDEMIAKVFEQMTGEKPSNEDLEEMRQDIKSSKLPAAYDESSKKIYIFAENFPLDKAEEGFFHENLHRGLHQYYGDGLREVAEEYWNNSTSEQAEANKQRISEHYADQPEKIKEEYLVHTMAVNMVVGRVDKLIARLGAENQEIIKTILKNIGYDRTKEAAGRAAKAGETLEEANQKGLEANRSEGRVRENQAQNPERPAEDTAETKGEDLMDVPFTERLKAAKGETNTNPTEEQKKAGNYKMGHVRFGGYRMSIENPKGSTRSGVDANGKPWSIEMKDTYGYIERKFGTDGDHLDFFINDDADLDNWAGRVFIVDQKNEDGTFDEHKVMYGYPNWQAAKTAYERNYEAGWWDKHVMQMLGVTKADFDEWLDDSNHKRKPFADYFNIKNNKDVVADNVDQLLADVKQRNELVAHIEPEKEPEKLAEVAASITEAELSKATKEELQALKKDKQKQVSFNRYFLKAADVKPGTDKEKKLQANMAQAEADIKAIDAEIARKDAEAKARIEQAEIGGAMIDRLEDMGVDVTTDLKEMRAARRLANKDQSKEGKMRHFETADGQIYGFVYKGKMYLDPRRLDAELPIHEYAHPWCEAMRRLNPDNWNNIVGLMKGDKDTWEFVKAMNPDLTDDGDIAEEMIAKFSGKKGAERAQAEFERMNAKDPDYRSKWANIWANISKAIQDFWKQVGDFLNIKYESAEQVYDQVVRDFANKINPRKRVEDWLKERDGEYLKAIEAGDKAKAKELFDAALRENIGNGIVPFIAVDNYRQMRILAHKVKERDPKVIAEVADKMAALIPKDAVLVPAPSHTGEATDMLDLAKAISERTGAPVADVLKSAERGSQYEAKYAGKPIESKEMGITMQGELPEGKLAVVIDNVVDTGNTAEACVQALGKAIVASLADSADRYKHVASLKSAEPVVVGKDGNVVPLSKRFEITSKYLEKAASAEPIEEKPSDVAREDIPEQDALAEAINGDITNEDVKRAVNSTLVKQWVSRKEGRDYKIVGENRFNHYHDIIRSMAIATLGIDNKYEVGGFFNDPFEAIIDYLYVAAKEGLSIRIINKHNFQEGERIRNILESEKPLYTEKELAEIEKRLKPAAYQDFLKAVQAVADEKRIEAEIKRIREYENGDAVTKALVLFDIANRRLRESSEKDTRLFTPVTYINGKQHKYIPDYQPKEGETVKVKYSMKKSTVNELARRIATTPIVKSLLSSTDAPKMLDVAREDASIVSLPNANKNGYNLNNALGRKLARLKREAGPHGIVGYIESETGDYMFVGDDADTINTLSSDMVIPASAYSSDIRYVRIPADKFDIISPKVVKAGYKMAITTDKIDEVDKMLDEADRRNEVADKKEAEERVKKYLSKKPKNEEEAARQRATKAVLKAMDKAGVPYKVVSRAEEKDMMRLFSMMNIEAVKDFARKWRKHSNDVHAKAAKFVVYNMSDPFGVPAYFEKKSTANFALKSMQQMAPQGNWSVLDIGYPGEEVENEEVKNAADMQADIEVWHGSGAVFTKFDHSHMGEGANSQSFGWGTYLSSSRKVAEGYTNLPGDIRYSHLGEEISKKDTVMIMAAEIMTDPTIKNSRDAEKFANRFRDKVVPGNEERLKLWDEVIEVLRNSQKSDFETNERTPILYKVDIPDDNGDNYLDYQKPVGKELAEKIRDFVYDHVMTSEDKGVYNGMDAEVIREDIDRVLEPESNMAWMQRALETRGVTPKEFSLWLSKQGYVGVKYPAGTIMGRGDNATNYVIFNEDDAKIVNTIEFMVSDGLKEGKRVMGWSDGKQVYLTEAGLNPNTPIHECTHLWDNWCKKEQPALWKKLVNAMKQTALWEEISKNPNYRNIWDDDDRMASEVHSRLSGNTSEDEFMKAAFKKDTPQSIINEVKSVLKKFWEAVLRLFNKHTKTIGDDFNSLESIIRMPLRDLLNQDFEKVMDATNDESAGHIDGHIEMNVTTFKDEKQQMKNLFSDAGWSEEEVDEFMNFAEGISKEIEKMRKEFPHLDAFSGLPANKKREILKSNPDYAGSFDYSFDCVKKEATDYVVQRMIEMGKSSHLGVTQIEGIRRVLNKHGYLTPCVMCYVEAKRKVMKQAKETSQRWNIVAEAAGLSLEPIGEATELTKAQMQALKEIANNGVENDLVPVFIAQKIAILMMNNPELRGRFNHEWLMTTDGYSRLYNKFAGTGLNEFLQLGHYKGKGLLDISPFSLNSISSDNLEGLFAPLRWASEGGVRQFSYEDARPIMFFDYFQQMMLLQAARVPLHLYTKRPFYPDLFGETGAMINQSIIVDIWKGTKEHQQHLGLDDKEYDQWLHDHAGFIPKSELDGSKDDSLVPYYSKDSFPIEEAISNVHNRRFGGCVGNVVVAPSDEFKQPCKS